MNTLPANVKLVFTSDSDPGYRRVRRGRGLRIVTASGAMAPAAVQTRAASLVIPPAWTDVWICRNPRGHLQATWRDARGRKQYRYHPAWHAGQGRDKFSRMAAFGKALPALRAKLRRDTRQPGLGREKVLAAVVLLLDATLIRIGNEEYARTNNSFGLTTLQDSHAKVRGGAVHFHFRGKSKVEHRIDLRDRCLAAIVKRCQDLPGQQLFQYRDDGGRHRVRSQDVNNYLRSVAGTDYTAKDFRTWAGTVTAVSLLQKDLRCSDRPAAVRSAIKAVAERLGNTVAVCRRYYIHPRVLEAHLANAWPKSAVGSGRAGMERLTLKLLKPAGTKQ